MKAPSNKGPSRFWFYFLGAVLTSGLGWLLTRDAGKGLERLSYDLPFKFRSGGSSNVIMVFVNPIVKRNLKVDDPALDENEPLSRLYHTRMVHRLRLDGAKLIFFDFTSFTEPSHDPAATQEFAREAREHGGVVLPGYFAEADQLDVLATTRLIPPVPELADVVSGWGLVNVHKDGDGAIRRMHMGTNDYPSVPWVAAKLLDAPITKNDGARLRERWINYYGPWGRIPSGFRGINFDHALATDGLPKGFFRDKIVIVCAGDDIGVAGAPQDEFASPYSRFGARLMFGGEVLAQSILNLVNGDWLERLELRWELALVIGWGFLSVLGLSGRKPWYAAALAFFALVLIGASAVHFQLKHHVWWNWLIPMLQTPLALAWSVGVQYGIEFRRQRQLRRAFSAYLSPYMADRIANSEFDLALGGKEVEATVLFTDLEGFTKMSESLAPSEVSKILTAYFNQTTRVILQEDGTIIKYIGDAVMAVWGAPLPDERHAERAVLAAWGMSEAGKREIAGRRLRTRLGINTGTVLAGNLGSDYRFDYTLIGDTTNFASRLEGLNKYLGTDILISESTRRALSDKIKVRFLGRFLVVGKKAPVGIYEVLGLTASFPLEPAWLTTFDEGLTAFVRGDWSEAERLMGLVMKARDGKDGPAGFYLHEIERARANVSPEQAWDGTVRIDSK